MARRAIETPSMDPAERAAMVAVRAYFKAEQRGFLPGHELDDWLAAEREIAAPSTKRKPAARKQISAAAAKNLG